MKKLLIVAVLLTFVFSCEEKPKNPVAEYGDNLMNAYEKGKKTGRDTNLVTVRQAIQAYHAANEKYPRDLEEIKTLMGGSLVDLSRYEYNPQNGTVTLKAN